MVHCGKKTAIKEGGNKKFNISDTEMAVLMYVLTVFGDTLGSFYQFKTSVAIMS